MKNFTWLFCIGLVACNGTLSEEQKRKIREEREESQIKKISEAAIAEGSFVYGRTIFAILQKISQPAPSPTLIDSVEKAFDVEIIFLQPNDSTLRAVEQKVIEAYISGGASTNLSDNIQKMGNDSILYTKPLMIVKPDGTVAFDRVVGIRMTKRRVIRNLHE